MPKIKAYLQLLKLRLSLTLTSTAAVGYVMAQPAFTWYRHWPGMLLVLVGGVLVTGAANTLNQLYEQDLDRLMARTAQRPLPQGILSRAEAGLFAFITGLAGLLLLGQYFNGLAAGIALVALVLYGGVYTSLKRVSPLCVAVGAVAGALPPLIGWAAATGTLPQEAWLLFGLQFIWQFPHFWAIAWVLDEDYRKAGFRLLPTAGGRDMRTAFQITTYTLVLIPLSLLPFYAGMTHYLYPLVALGCGVVFLLQTVYLLRTMSQKAARRLMFGSFLYLPVVMAALVYDRL